MNTVVVDPFGAGSDPKMPFVAQAIEPLEAERQIFNRCLSRKRATKARLHAIRVVRYLPGRRCSIEYDLELETGHGPSNPITILGKCRTKGVDTQTYQLLLAFWRGPFSPHSADRNFVPEPIGLVPKFQMWLQAKAVGTPAAQLLTQPAGEELARRIAEMAYKFHQADLPVHRSHTIADELRVLRESLQSVAQAKPDWTKRLERLTNACIQLSATIPRPLRFRGIHHDFQPSQIMINDRNLCLVAFDSYCKGDPALDIGNFIAHITELSLRQLGDPTALAKSEKALEDRFVELNGEACRPGVRAYSLLALARQIFAAFQSPERQPLAGKLLDLCEERICSGR